MYVCTLQRLMKDAPVVAVDFPRSGCKTPSRVIRPPPGRFIRNPSRGQFHPFKTIDFFCFSILSSLQGIFLKFTYRRIEEVYLE